MKPSALLTLVGMFVLTTGCDAPQVGNPVTVADAGVTEPAPEPTTTSRVPDSKVEHPEWYLPDGRLDMSGIPGEPPMTTSTPRKVHAKDPKKGKLTRRRGGKLLGTTLQALPWAENETIFNIVIPSQLATYDALEGRPVRSHEEFMDKFVNGFMQQHQPGFKLPELEPGDEYLFDPEDKVLKIYRPEG